MQNLFPVINIYSLHVFFMVAMVIKDLMFAWLQSQIRNFGKFHIKNIKKVVQVNAMRYPFATAKMYILRKFNLKLNKE